MRVRAQGGFSVVEVIVAMLIVVIALLGMASGLAGAAKVNRLSSDRQKALDLATERIEQFRSLPYGQVYIPQSSSDPSVGAADYRQQYCPILDLGPNACNDTSSNVLVVDGRTNNVRSGSGGVRRFHSAGSQPPEGEPQHGKSVQFGSPTGASTYLANGIILYTYVYWVTDGRTGAPGGTDVAAGSRRYKVVTVVARYRDPADTSPEEAQRGAVRLSAAIIDNPGVDTSTFRPPRK